MQILAERRNPREAWIVVDNAHEALIDKDLFEQVQAKIFSRRRSKPGASYRTHTRRNEDAFLFSGLVICAHCSCKMHGTTMRRFKNGTEYRYWRYVCSSYCRSGQNNPHQCGCHGVDQRFLLETIVSKLQQNLFTSDCQASLRESITTLVDAQRREGLGDQDALRRQIAELDRDIDRAADNFLRAPSEVLDLVSQKLTSLKRQRENAMAQLRAIQATADPVDATKEIDAVMARLKRLGTDLVEGEPARRREVFRELIDRIELRFEKKPRGKRVECPLQSGLIHLRTGEGSIFGSVSRGAWHSLEPCWPDYVAPLLQPDAQLRQIEHLTRQCA